MSYYYSDFPSRSQRLVAAGQQLLQSLGDDTIDRSIAIQDIEAAAQANTAFETVMRFSAAPSQGAAELPEAITPDDALSSVLLDLQAANVLLSAGVALNEHGRGSNTSCLIESIQQAESSRAIVTSDLAALASLPFAPAAGVKSSNLEEATKKFRENADGVLRDFVDDANKVVNDVLEKLKKFDSAKIIEGINKLGESFQIAAAAGKLIQQGLELLKKALDALSKLFGKEALASTKKKVADIWAKFQSGQYTHDALAWAFDVKGTEAKIDAALGQANVAIGAIDDATNDLPGLSTKYKSKMKLLSSLMSAVAVAGAIISVLNLAAPVIPLAIAGAYAALIGATVLVGMDYCDSGVGLGWVRGVGQIASDIRP
jgi:hypothetical protein